MNTNDVCQRCMTTHPLDDAGERPCPKAKKEREATTHLDRLFKDREKPPAVAFIIKI